MRELNATVVSVYGCIPGERVKSRRCGLLNLTMDGIEGDKHFGRLKKAGGREKMFAAKGEEVLNLRQVSIVCPKELVEVARTMEIPEIFPEDLGANILLGGLPNLTLLPAGTHFIFPSGAVIYVTAENAPCILPGTEIALRNSGGHGLIKRAIHATTFPKSALHRRGLVALVIKPGIVRPNDSVRVLVPEKCP